MRKIGYLALITAIICAVNSCGRKGPVLAPLKKIPVPVSGIDIRQVGKEIRLSWTPQAVYADGSGFSEGSVELWLISRENGVDATASPSSAEFRNSGRIIMDIFMKFRENGISEQSASYVPEEENPFARTYFFRLRCRDASGRKSDFSDPVDLDYQAVSLPPSGLKAEVLIDRIKLSWDEPEKGLNDSDPGKVKGYHIYRTAEKEGLETRINQTAVKRTSFSDQKFDFGVSYTYFIRAVQNEARPLRESENSAEISVTPEDIFPPEVPRNLISISGNGAIALKWDPVDAADLAGYRVWRKEDNETEFVPINPEPFRESTFEDGNVKSGVRYYYSVTSVDQAGNESAKSEVISEILQGEK